MTTQLIDESGMSFGPYPEGQCFYIEKSNTYHHIQQNVQIAEFLLLRTAVGCPPVIWVVEAKSSSPRPETQPNFDEFIAEIRDKLINAFSLGLASCLKRHLQTAAELPVPFMSLDLSEVDIKFVLVINGHDEKWLSPIQDALNKSLLVTRKTWALSPTCVAVINDVIAAEYDLIQCSV